MLARRCVVGERKIQKKISRRPVATTLEGVLTPAARAAHRTDGLGFFLPFKEGAALIVLGSCPSGAGI